MTAPDDMPAEPDYQRLAQFVKRRRKDLGLTQEQVRGRGGPSSATQRQIERGEPIDYRSGTTQPLEHALEWVAGSVRSVLSGGVPVPYPPETVAPDSDDSGVLASLPAEAIEGLGAAERAEVVAAMKLEGLKTARAVRRRVDE